MPIEPHDDGLVIPEVGRWSKYKYHFLGRYLRAFMIAMKPKPWAGLYYLDLFAGAGFARVEESGEFVAGSPVLAALTTPSFTQIRAAEADAKKCDALRQRLARADLPTSPLVLHGNANDLIDQLLAGIPDRSLCMTFIDPYGFHAEWDTIRRLSEVRSDLILFLPDHLDAMRNWELHYEADDDSNLDRFLGKQCDWRSAFNAVNRDRIPEVLRSLYETQLKTIGYRHFDHRRIYGPQQRGLYLLHFASRHQAGVTIWRNVGKTDAGGQRELF